MKNLILIIFLIFTFSASAAHTTFRPGFIVTNEGDTIFGMVRYFDDSRMHRFCEMQPENQKARESFQPGQIASYGFVGDKVFESHQIKIHENDTEFMFLEVLVRGEASLYRAEKFFFMGRRGSEIFRIHNDSEEIMVNGKRMMRKTNQYYGIMSLVFSDCPEIGEIIRKTKFTERDLTFITGKYNDCVSADYVVFKEGKPWVKPIIGLSGGYSSSRIEFDPRIRDMQHLDGPFSHSRKPFVGLSIEINSPRIIERVYLRSDIYYLSTNYFLYNYHDESSAMIRRINIDYISVHLDQIKIPVGIQYLFPGSFASYFINTGISKSFHIKKESNWVNENESYGLFVRTQQDALKIRESHTGFWAGVGAGKLISGKLIISAEIRFEKNNGIAVRPTGVVRDVGPVSNLKLRNNNLQLFFTIKTN
jgi:hypothetical protein